MNVRFFTLFSLFLIFFTTFSYCTKKELTLTKKERIKVIENLDDSFIEITKDFLFENPNTSVSKASTIYYWFHLKSTPNENYGLYQVITFYKPKFLKKMTARGATYQASSSIKNFESHTSLAVLRFNKNSNEFQAIKVDTDDTTTMGFSYKGEQKFFISLYELGETNTTKTSNAFVAIAEATILKKENRKKIIGDLDFNKIYKKVWNDNHAKIK